MNETIIKINLQIVTKFENTNDDDDEITTFKSTLKKSRRERKSKISR